MSSEPDAYRALQVDPAADSIVISAAYRVLARRYHPDGERPDSIRMCEINRAYAVLRDPEKRRQYDRQRQQLRAVGLAAHDTPVARFDPWQRPGGRTHTSEPSPGEVAIDFGRYAGWRLRDLARHDADYLRWLARQSVGVRYREHIRRLLPNEPDLDRRANSVA